MKRRSGYQKELSFWDKYRKRPAFKYASSSSDEEDNSKSRVENDSKPRIDKDNTITAKARALVENCTIRDYAINYDHRNFAKAGESVQNLPINSFSHRNINNKTEIDSVTNKPLNNKLNL